MSTPEDRIELLEFEDPFYGVIRPDYDDVVFMYANDQKYDHLRLYIPEHIFEDDEERGYLFKIQPLFVERHLLDRLKIMGMPVAQAPYPTIDIIDSYERDVIHRLSIDMPEIVWPNEDTDG